MKLAHISPDDLIVSSDLGRSGSAKQFQERLQASIEEIGLAEPIKAARLPSGQYLVIDGVMRLQAIREIRSRDPSRFPKVPAYVVDYARRYEIRYQTDIYQDLLPSQLATLVEHLHQTENVRKVDIARYIGVSPATLRNYTGLWRLVRRGGLFARIVELMDVQIIPASNPYAWLRLTEAGLDAVFKVSFSSTEDVNAWIDERVQEARAGGGTRYQLSYVEDATGNLPAGCYREGEAVRTVKRDLGLRRAAALPKMPAAPDMAATRQHLTYIRHYSKEAVLKSAARSLEAYLK
jgi:ParB-like chromosome segregation protein Spo0J